MIAGIVLAAGASRRMGTLKQLLPLGTKTVIEIVVQQVRSRLERVVVVLGHRADDIASVLAGYEVECIVNPDHRAGMLSSVKCGIRAAGTASGYLICLGDQPAIDPEAIEALVAAAAAGNKGIVIPVFEGRRGHPVLIDHCYGEEILALNRHQGLNTVTRAHPGDTLEIAVSGRSVLEDLDTPADYDRERARRGPGAR